MSIKVLYPKKDIPRELARALMMGDVPTCIEIESFYAEVCTFPLITLVPPEGLADQIYRVMNGMGYIGEDNDKFQAASEKAANGEILYTSMSMGCIVDFPSVRLLCSAAGWTTLRKPDRGARKMTPKQWQAANPGVIATAS